MADWTELALLGPTYGWFALAWLYCAWCLAACAVLDQARTGQAPGHAHNQVSAINHAGVRGWCRLDFPGLSGLCVPGLELAWLWLSRWHGFAGPAPRCLGWLVCAGPTVLDGRAAPGPAPCLFVYKHGFAWPGTLLLELAGWLGCAEPSA
jgi:hypothetical protein